MEKSSWISRQQPMNPSITRSSIKAFRASQPMIHATELRALIRDLYSFLPSSGARK